MQEVHLACLAIFITCLATPCWILVIDAAPSVQTHAQFFESMLLLAKWVSRQQITSAAVLVRSSLQIVSRHEPCRVSTVSYKHKQ